MPQNANVEKETHYDHNNRGTNPSHFNDVKDLELRHTNRGNIMANIFERYTTKTPSGARQLLSKDFLMMSRELGMYLDKMPENERGSARKAMMGCLKKRGYNES